MTKGKFNIALGAVAVVAFALAFFNQPIILVLLVGYAVVVEGNNWLSKQTLQALYLQLAFTALFTLISWVFNGFDYLLNLVAFYNAVSVMGRVETALDGVVSLLLLVTCIIAAVKVAGDKDANLPLFGTLADKSLGLFVKKVPVYTYQPQQPAAGQYTAPSQYTAPVQQPAPAQYTAPVQHTAPAQAAAPVQPAAHSPYSAPAQQPQYKAPVQPAQPAAPSQPAAATWTCSCGRVNTGKFCAACGAKNPNLT